MSASTKEQTSDVCCPEFDPTKWEDKVFNWENKRFIKEKVLTFLYMPLNFGSVMKKLDKQVSGVGTSLNDNICLSHHTSKWKMDIYLEVDRQIPDARNVELSGKFFSKVYEGPFKDTGKWGADFNKAAKLKGFSVDEQFTWYTTCPKCAKKYGKNYVALIGKVAAK